MTKPWLPLSDWPLQVVVDGLRAPNSATRIAAAAKLRHVGSPSQLRLDVEIACLSDPVPAVRYHALRALVTNEPDRRWLVELLTSDREADAGLRTSVLADLGAITGPDSPFRGKRAARALRFTVVVGSDADTRIVVHNILHYAARCARSAETVLPILRAARRADMSPIVFARWDHDHVRRAPAVPMYHMPDRCCVCGALHPSGSEDLSVCGKWNERPYASVLEAEWTRVNGRLSVPVCADGRCHPPIPVVFSAGLGVAFPSPLFVAELLYHDTWLIFSGDVSETLAGQL